MRLHRDEVSKEYSYGLRDMPDLNRNCKSHFNARVYTSHHESIEEVFADWNHDYDPNNVREAYDGERLEFEKKLKESIPLEVTGMERYLKERGPDPKCIWGIRWRLWMGRHILLLFRHSISDARTMCDVIRAR